MTAIGIGWRHPHHQALLEQRPALDFIEAHSENFFAQGGAALALLRSARAHYSVSLHGVGLGLGSAVGVDDWHLDQLARLVEAIEPVRVSDHACFARASIPGMGTQAIHAADLLPIAFTHASLDVLCRNVQRVQERLKRPLMVENLSAYVNWAEADYDEPAFLQTLAQRTGCALLVDINNIYVNALNVQIAASSPKVDRPDTAHSSDLSMELFDPVLACMAWLDRIAPATVGEMHLAGHCRADDAHGEIVIDDHSTRVCAPVWQLYAHAARRFAGVPTLIEWDTELPALEVLLDEAAQARAIAQGGL